MTNPRLTQEQMQYIVNSLFFADLDQLEQIEMNLIYEKVRRKKQLLERLEDKLIEKKRKLQLKIGELKEEKC